MKYTKISLMAIIIINILNIWAPQIVNTTDDIYRNISLTSIILCFSLFINWAGNNTTEIIKEMEK